MTTKRKIIIMVVLALVAIILACGNSRPTAQKTGEVPIPTEPSSPIPTPSSPIATPVLSLHSFEIGDIVDTGGFTLVVNGMETDSIGVQFAKPEEGWQFVYVDVTIINITDKAQRINGISHMKLKDETNQRYSVDGHAAIASDKDSPNGELAPGETVRGIVAFHVPIGTQLIFMFGPSVGGKAAVNLQ